VNDHLLTFDSQRTLNEWTSGKLAHLTTSIVLDGAGYAFDGLGWLPVVTCIYRTPEEDRALEGTGVHTVWRAVDLRTRDHRQPDVDALVAYLNGRWVYDPTRPAMVVAYARPHGTGPHLHIQSHPRTALRATPRSA
jgi:hypothetical protein